MIERLGFPHPTLSRRAREKSEPRSPRPQPVGLNAVDCRSNSSGQRELGQAVVAHLFHEITYAAQLVTLVNCPLDGTHPFPSEHESSQLTKLPSHLRFLIGPLIIAAGALAQADALATIF